VTSRSEAARRELFEALFEAYVDGRFADAKVAAPTRNRDVATLLSALASSEAAVLLNVRDGDIEVTAEALGEDGDSYELAVRCQIEWLVEHPISATRDWVFDEGLELIASVIEEDRSLSGSASMARIERIDFSNLVTDGAPQIKAASIVVLIELTSPRPF
jgi:hypothetical protein